MYTLSIVSHMPEYFICIYTSYIRAHILSFYDIDTTNNPYFTDKKS